MSHNDTAPDARSIELAGWYSLLTHPSASLIFKQIEKRKEVYQSKIKELVKIPTLDNSVQIAVLNARIDELEQMAESYKLKVTQAKSKGA